MTTQQIRHEMKIRLQVVRDSAALAVMAIEKEDFSDMQKLLEDMKRYAALAEMDHKAAYAASR